MLSLLILMVCGAVAAVLLYPPLARAPLWRAAITPLASIIGSGFLVLGPILSSSFGAWAPLVMAGLCAVAYLFGSAIRFNIAYLDRTSSEGSHHPVEVAASWALALAYVISVAYYLNLLGSFAATLIPQGGPDLAKLITTGVFVIILGVGWTRGFSALERLELLAVGLKLSIVAGLLFGLGWYFSSLSMAHALVVQPVQLGPVEGILLAFGLLVTVQGFETSRYLGAEYDAVTRVRSMRLAQGISTAIYLIYITLLCFSIVPDAAALNETSIIGMTSVIAPILPALLLVAAMSAQFSAAVADTNGSGGLLTELTRGRLSARAGYSVLVACGLVLTWAFSVFEIIGYASRAFAIYYALQSFIAARRAAAHPSARKKAVLFAMLAMLGILIAVFGESAE
ncbi:APC family permease [Sulfitobacter guttiformis]|uniref:Uncharacterized protein n=1 Tax=Sulfitobacter guttiformis TaxID=74349 RepID=A0A420DQ51_9RHOB|nr:membrane protein [Sulfitobacter guttiformis]KIN73637.1 putative membrane protein [Sulfitobacter guttiformis KCTC 32187]RKE96283.1 hypothetical protein C8N30_0840 [Sulfitobacter guttiformis]